MVPLTDPVVFTIDAQLNKLQEQMISLNQKANLHGLFSYFILYDVLDFPVNWNVLCADDGWLKDTFQNTNVYHIAALGYSLQLNSNTSNKNQAMIFTSYQPIEET